MTADRTDHIAEAVRLAKLGEEHFSNAFGHADHADAYARLAQVHATLATRGEPAGHPVTPYREALAELREAVQEYIVDRDAHTPPGLRDAPPLARLRALLGRPS